MNNYIKSKYVILDSDISSKEEAFKKVSELALEAKLVDDSTALIKAFEERESLDSTAFDGGFAIPHARSKSVKDTGIFFIRFLKPIKWDSTNKETDCAIFLVVPEGQGDYLDVLSGVATKLLDKKIVDILKKTKDINEIIKVISAKQEVKESNVAGDNALSVVGISACATGVVHTYMARDAILEAGKKLNWNVNVETQGQKGVEFKLTDEQIEKADAVILAVDITVDLERFAGKKVYKIGTKALIADPETHVRYAVSKGKMMDANTASAGGAFDIKNGKAWIQHIMSGVSFMIPFIVFAGILFAVVTGIGKGVYGTWLDYSGGWDGKTGDYVQKGVVWMDLWGTAPGTEFIKDGANWVLDGQKEINGILRDQYNVTIAGPGIGILFYLNSFAGIGFTLMIPIMGAYIGNSIAGRAAIAPAMILSWAASTPATWMKWGVFADMADKFPGNGAGIFGALACGFAAGYTVKWINTKWKINKYIQPIMPIIIIPLFLSLIYGAVVIFIFGNIFGIIMGYVNMGLLKLEETAVGMALLGLVLGLLAGVDMGGPINKIASFGATALITIDNGAAMGTAAAAFAIAPMGAGIATMIFRKRFKDDKELGINATILGFMGISEGAIPFAVKYTWAAMIPNIICSGIAGMFAGLMGVSGWVGAWGGPIIALFGGVTSGPDMSYIGVLWYLLAIAIGIACHIVLFRILVEFQINGKMTGTEFKAMFKKSKKEKVAETNKEFVEQI